MIAVPALAGGNRFPLAIGLMFLVFGIVALSRKAPELKMLHDEASVIDVRLAGDPGYQVDNSLAREDRTTLRFEVFGRPVHVRRSEGGWQVLYPGADGKTRVAHDMQIPSHVEESSLGGYLFDLCHEWATPAHSQVRLVSDEPDSAV